MTNETMIPHGEGPVICSECKNKITSRLYWRRWDNGKIVFVCNKCAKSMIDEHTANGLMTALPVDAKTIDEVIDEIGSYDPDDSDYEFEIQAARKGEE